MVAELKLINVSGTIGNFIGSQAVVLTLLVGLQSGTNQFLPIQCSAAGELLTA